MLEREDYKRLNRFKDIIHAHVFVDDEYAAFRQRAAAALDEVFGYDHSLFGALNNTGKRQINFSVRTHNLDIEFSQALLGSNILQESRFYDSGDVILFSEYPNYAKRSLYRDVMKPSKYSDFMLLYMQAGGVYNGFIIIIKTSSSGKPFTKKDKEIAENLRNYLGADYANYREYLLLQTNNNLLKTQINYYPIGVLLMKSHQEVSYANEIAQGYLREIGISKLSFMGVFFTNHILPYIKYEMQSVGKKSIIRYKSFIFSVIPQGGFSEEYFQLQEDMDLSYANLTRQESMIGYHIYILKDELSAFNRHEDFFVDYAFSKKEEQVVEQVLLGKMNKQIAEDLNISVNTVRAHMQNIFKKTGVTSRNELVFKINNGNLLENNQGD